MISLLQFKTNGHNVYSKNRSRLKFIYAKIMPMLPFVYNNFPMLQKDSAEYRKARNFTFQ